MGDKVAIVFCFLGGGVNYQEKKFHDALSVFN